MAGPDKQSFVCSVQPQRVHDAVQLGEQVGKERGRKEGKCPALSRACCRPVPEPQDSQGCAVHSLERMGKRRRGSSPGQRTEGSGDSPCGQLS